MSAPSSHPEDQGPFDAAAATPAGEQTFTADDPAAPDAVQYDADQQEADHADELEQGDDVELDPLEQGDESNVDPDLGISQ